VRYEQKRASGESPTRAKTKFVMLRGARPNFETDVNIISNQTLCITFTFLNEQTGTI
jgi:hypothetical protein